MSFIDRKFAAEYLTTGLGYNHAELLREFYHFNDEFLDSSEILLTYWKDTGIAPDPVVLDEIIVELKKRITQTVNDDSFVVIGGVRRLLRKAENLITKH